MWHIIGNYRNRESVKSGTDTGMPDNKPSDANAPPVDPFVITEERASKGVKSAPSTNYELDDLSAELDDLFAELFAEPLGVIVAQNRIDGIIANLKKETLEESLANLDNVDEFYYPGFYSNSVRSKPFDAVHTILSNRRFIKLYDQLRSKSHNEQYIYLNKTFKDKLLQYYDLLSRYNNPSLSRDDYLDFARISDIPGKPRTLSGTRLAMQSIALLSGALGNVQMCPELREAFQNPTIGRKASLDEYDTSVRQSLNRHPVFPIGIQAQVIWLLSQYSEEDEATQYGLDSSNAKSFVSDNMLQTINVPNYQSRTTIYDLSFISWGKPVDLSYGWHSFKFLLTDDIDLLKHLISTTVRHSQ
jgi:hypothetical protein